MSAMLYILNHNAMKECNTCDNVISLDCAMAHSVPWTDLTASCVDGGMLAGFLSKNDFVLITNDALKSLSFNTAV